MIIVIITQITINITILNKNFVSCSTIIIIIVVIIIIIIIIYKSSLSNILTFESTFTSLMFNRLIKK